jgi:bifunctional non-homologous end joining protein LigD
MLASLVGEPFDHPDWVFEPKFDGLRILGIFDGKNLTLLSRNQQAQNFQFPDVEQALRAVLTKRAIVDGEIVCFDQEGRTSFRALQQRFHLKDAAEVRDRMQRFPAYLYLFDLLYLDRFDVTGLPLPERKALLDRAVRWSKEVRRTPSEAGNGIARLDEACRRGEEGIIAKFKDSAYVSGRSAAWLKIKCVGRQEFVVGGFTDPQRSRVGLGALLVGYYGNDRRSLHFAGKVGTGYTRDVLLDLRGRLERIETAKPPFTERDLPRGTGVHWVQPKLVAEIAFAEWTQNGRLRQPRFEGLRPDKSPKDCIRERPKALAPLNAKQEQPGRKREGRHE